MCKEHWHCFVCIYEFLWRLHAAKKNFVKSKVIFEIGIFKLKYRKICTFLKYITYLSTCSIHWWNATKIKVRIFGNSLNLKSGNVKALMLRKCEGSLPSHIAHRNIKMFKNNLDFFKQSKYFGIYESLLHSSLLSST